ncbi:MAG: hypothetical protein ACI4KG_05500, partial [Oscillospiraceae bacterium]
KMKITAYFDSPDSADFAAGALKRAISPLSTIKIKEPSSGSDKINMNIFSSYNPAVTTPTYSMPVYTPAAFADNNVQGHNDSIKNDCIIEVICRKEDYPAVSKIIISHGGRNISKL